MPSIGNTKQTSRWIVAAVVVWSAAGCGSSSRPAGRGLDAGTDFRPPAGADARGDEPRDGAGRGGADGAARGGADGAARGGADGATLADAAGSTDADTGTVSTEPDFFSSFEPGDPPLGRQSEIATDKTGAPTSGLKSVVGAGPGAARNAKTNVGFTGTHALGYAGQASAAGGGLIHNEIFAIDRPIVASSELSYRIFPASAGSDAHASSAWVSIDLAFADGTYLSDLAAVDQHFVPLTPRGQGASRTLYADEWNHIAARIGAVAAGKVAKRILVAYDNPAGANFAGWLDDIRITDRPAPLSEARLSDYVVTTRGTNSSDGYSRGNNIPAAAVPHGFNFWTPSTDASAGAWTYAYHQKNNADNLPILQALSLSHQPSPWMGDRQTFQVMPAAAATPNPARGTRGLAFKHDNEVARPYYYGVVFENGIKAEIAPTDHAALFRFGFPANDASLIFDNVTNEGGLTLDLEGGTVTGYSDVKSGLSVGASRLFVYATFDRPVIAGGMLPGAAASQVTGYLRFGLDASRVVVMRIATSLISVAQAKANLALEIAANDTFDAVKERAQKQWDDQLGIITVEGANRDQLTTFYSNLYRLFLYPNSGFENAGTNAAPNYQHASPVAPAKTTSTATTTGAAVMAGKIYVNNGFWDTYRTTWPAYALLTPNQAGLMIDGFLQQYREGGWVSRWSSPGYAALMTGTSSDVAFADAYLKGVTNFDVTTAYDAALRNATVAPTSGAVGRNGLMTSIFLGYTSTATGAGLSWALAGYHNDFGIANMAAALAAVPGEPRKQQYAEEAEYFLNRTQNYVHAFDPSIQFFQGRSADGSWRLTPGLYDPQVWGYDYTETNGWNTAFDAPYDGQGLINLYGGKDKLAAKLDLFFSTPERAALAGSYGGVIHEMREARDVRMGQLGLSNQPSFHIPYLYNFVGQPWRTQEKVRDALARLWVGSEIGQGYLGDEDNGSTSAWQIFGALGIYPLQVGSPNYVIGSPLFTKATIHLENGKTIAIVAANNSPKNIYVQGVKVNGAAYSHTYLPHALLANGATLEFDMGPAVSSWGTGPGDAPPSITKDGNVPKPLRDAVEGGNGTASAADGSAVNVLFDNSSATQIVFKGASASVQYQFSSGAPAVSFYTLTSGNVAGGDPSDWTLSGSTDGRTWTIIDQRSAQVFAWRLQTRAFKVAMPGAHAFYKIEMTGKAALRLAEVELLMKP